MTQTGMATTLNLWVAMLGKHPLLYQQLLFGFCTAFFVIQALWIWWSMVSVRRTVMLISLRPGLRMSSATSIGYTHLS